jgi:hypothetical protein
MADEEPEPEAEEQAPQKEGVLVYLFRGKKNPVERFVFTEMCKKFGLDWARMEAICPWRSRRNWCASWKKLTHIQAVGEFKTTRADPYTIRDAHRHLCKTGLRDDKYVYKNGRLVNKNPMLSMERRNAARDANQQKYSLSEEQSAAIEIPIIFPIEFLQQQTAKRRAALQAKLAAIAWVKARREGRRPDLKIPNVSIVPGRFVKRPPRYATALSYSTLTDRYIFDLQSVIDGTGGNLPF